MTEPKKFYTYLHRDRVGRAIYVGCATANPRKRGVRAKLQRAFSTSGHTAAWKTATEGGYTVEVLSMFDNRCDAFAHERKSIAELRLAGEPLTNICDGGPGALGAKDSPDTRRKKAVSKIGERNPMYGVRGLEHPMSRVVVHTLAGVFYESVQDAADIHGFKMKTLYNWLSGHRPNPTPLEFA